MELVPGMQIATDIICGFPVPPHSHFSAIGTWRHRSPLQVKLMKIFLTVVLIKEYKLAQVHISQFYPRPG
ncbi:hypothetical protein K7X08_025764 [Anisodus acutangulus]|uniref:Uncharacterized protein n=1 Tax=Anisodus acutangulus TaxID=402998 RepID=A0A9Q1LB75_9SOLA|nr:hypothetical protein K7X08_025764 [Anisodus acutangulus]